MDVFYVHAWAKCDFCTKLLTKAQIAEKLNALRFVTRYGKPFRAEQVKRLYLRASVPAPG